MTGFTHEQILQMVESTGVKVLADVVINRTVTDMEDVFESPEYKAMYEAFVDEHKPFARKHREMYRDYKAHFTDQGIFEEYTVEDGLRIFRKLDTFLCITNTPFNTVHVYDNEFFIVIESWFAKTASNRAILAKIGRVVTDDF